MNATATAEIAAAKRAEEDAIWEAEGRRVAQRVVAEQVAAMEDHILDAFRNDLHRERRDLVNAYTGTDRKQKIADLDLVIGAVEEEQAKRAGLASSADILATFANPDFVTVQDADHLATLLDVDEDEKAPAEQHYAVECQDEDTHGVHSARFLYVNKYGQTVYTVVCAGFEERYTSEVVYEVSTPVDDSATN